MRDVQRNALYHHVRRNYCHLSLQAPKEHISSVINIIGFFIDILEPLAVTKTKSRALITLKISQFHHK